MNVSKIEDIIKWYQQTPDFEILINKYITDDTLRDDAKQDIILIILEYNREKIIDMYDQKTLKFFLIRVITNQLFSKNSLFYRTHLKNSHYELTDEIQIPDENDTIEVEKQCVKIDKKHSKIYSRISKFLKNYQELTHRNNMDVILFNYYIENKTTYRKMGKLTGINHSQIHQSVTHIHKLILSQFKTSYDDVQPYIKYINKKHTR